MVPSERENVSRCSTKLIHFGQKLLLALDCRQSKYSLEIHNIHIFFNFGHGFCGSFSILFPKASASGGKEVLK